MSGLWPLALKLIDLFFQKEFSLFQRRNMECVGRRAFKFSLDLSVQFCVFIYKFLNVRG